ncbi:hypothetical protein ACQX0N_14035, partial [Clostridium tepidum]
MDNNSLAHTKWKCKYHIVFAPKYRRKEKRDRENTENVLMSTFFCTIVPIFLCTVLLVSLIR